MGRLCLLVMMLVLLNGYCCLGCWEQERIAFLQIKVDINFPNGISLQRWVDNETANCCDWEEIKCSVDTGRVIQISLNGTREYGRSGDWYFNASLFLPFEELRTLHLLENSLVGWLENEGFERLSMLRNLQVIDLSYNNFNINILSRLSGFPSLKYLSLRSNNFFLKGSTHFNSSERLSRLNNLEVLDLRWNYLNGSVLSFLNLNDLNSLKELYLSGNNLQSFEPIQGLSNLEILDLSNNWFNNSTLSFGGGLSSLKSLDLSWNKLKGTVDMRELDALTNLEVLDLSYNEIDSLVTPKDTKIFKKLKELNLHAALRKSISRNLVQSLGAFSSLKTLYLGGSYTLKGPITVTAEDLGNLPNLEALFLDYSSPNNNFLQSIGVLASLKNLSMFECELNHTLPTLDWDNLLNLETLILDGSSLNNNFLQSVGVFTSLKILSMSNCELNGSLSTQGWCELKNLQKLDLSGNQLEDLSDNNLTGTIPKWIGSLSALTILLLKGNQFKGTIPIQLCHLNRLRIMDLSHNNLFGPIPHCLGNISLDLTTGQSNAVWNTIFSGDGSLYYYVLSTDLMGSLASSFLMLHQNPLAEVQLQVEFTTKRNSLLYNGSILNYMSGIDLSCNQLAGEIPPELGNLSDIRALNLSHNNLTGTIPGTLSKLKQVESLDLSYNNLNGRIPTQLIELNALAVFSVAHNNLSGALPEMKAQFGTFEETSYEGNPLLCGPPLHKSCTKNRATSPMQNVSNGQVEEDGFVDMDAFYITFVVSYIIVLLGIAIVLYINPYWRQAWFYFIEVYITSR
ncbi:hypothetical protein F0562_008448 [Nyssa sinensis]|uniref:Leucine-rich repeat-containing N-terminal plant-type domain-containing protein n=1 Tax=Nyssa sinensis TaxID=561372 RepID=A0A5J5A7T7_9ASTE|nr:hypothetical protein F0562_008448 [Nyssa sinensis]